MTNKELLKEIMKLPKAETDNPINTMNSINVDDLMSAIDRLNKVPDYNDLLKENQELKKQLEERTKMYQNAYDYSQKMEGKAIILETQQKEFIKYLEDEIHSCEAVSDLLFNSNKKMKVYKEILQKYKEIIEGNKDEK